MGSVFLLSTTLDAYCMCNRTNTTVGLERIFSNYIGFVACIASGDTALRLDRSESSFVLSSISNSDSSSTFRDLHHVQCARSVLSKTVLRTRGTHSACKGTGSTRNARIIWWVFQKSKIIAAGTAQTSQNASATWILVLVGWFCSPQCGAHQFASHGTFGPFLQLQLYNFTTFTSWTQSRIKGAEATAIRDYQRETYYHLSQVFHRTFFICIYVI